jgi:hypothetical protein
MPKAIDLLNQGRDEELWQMCCGFLSLNIREFMDIQKRLMLKQLELLNNCPLGEKIMHGAKPKTIEEFRRLVPLNTYKDYCPELLEKKEDLLPGKPAEWVHTSGRSGEYPCKWVPLTPEFLQQMSVVSFGIAIISTSKDWKDTSRVVKCPRIINAVAPRPYMSGALAKMLDLQSPSKFMPPLEGMDNLSFEERIQLGFRQSLSQGLDGFCGLSLVLVKVGEKISQASNKASILPLIKQPKAVARLLKGLLKSKLAGRPILPRDLWNIKGILSGGLDSWVYRDKIKELWGRYPLDVYCGTEGGIIATQTWDYDSMTFVPNLNFLEFIPEEELVKWEMDHSYQPETLLLDEVKVGQNYEIVITNFHGGAMTRYRPGDLVRISSLRNEKLGIDIPQMVFEQRIDGMLDFVVVRLTEKTIWQAIENTGIPYEDWTAYKEPGQQLLKLFVELKEGHAIEAAVIASAVHGNIMNTNNADLDADSPLRDDFASTIDFKVEVTVLPSGSFANFMAQRQAKGADLAHLKPPHVNASNEVLAELMGEIEEIEVVKTKTATKAKEIAT